MPPDTSMDLFSILRFILNHPLSEGRKIRNVGRFVTWQLRSRLVTKPTTFCFANDARMFVTRGMTGITGNLYVGLHEFEDMAFALHFLKPGDLFVDVGANVGSYTILAAAAVGADVVAFEPGREAREWLLRNIRLNNVEARVEVHDQAVGGESGSRLFTVGLDTVNHLVPDGQALTSGAETVAAVTLDEALGGRPATMLKVDVEGFESEVIRGARSTLANSSLNCALLELGGTGTQYGFDEKLVHDTMEGFGFTLCRYDPLRRRISAHEGAGHGGNALFVRDLDHVAARVATAAPFLVHGERI